MGGSILQNPVSREAVLISRDKWNVWEDREPPSCDYVIQTWDTAHEKGNRNDPSAMQTWGVFHLTDEDTGIDEAQCHPAGRLQEANALP